MKYLFTLLTFSVLTFPSNKKVDFELIAKKYNAKYFNSEVINVQDGNTFVIGLPNKKKGILSKTITIQNNKREINLQKTGKFEFILFEKMLILKNRSTIIIYKLSNSDIPDRLKKDLKSFEVIDLFGLGVSSGIDLEYMINFNKEEVTTSILKSLNYDTTSSYAGNSCGCNKFTTSCSCSKGSLSCSVSCTSEAYACCVKDLGLSCKCKEKKPNQ